MTETTRPVWIEINLNNLRYNYQQLKQRMAEGVGMMSVVKANAYGHGVIPVAKTLIEEGTDRLAVALPEEGVELRKAGVDIPIHVLGEVLPAQYQLLLDYNLIPTICKKTTLVNLNQLAAKKNISFKIHIKVDTGMGRIGVTCDSSGLDFVKKAVNLSNIEVEGLMTHFATADEKDKEYSYYQWEKFKYFVSELENEGIEIPVKHAANSAAIIDLPRFQLDMVRPGIALYGLYPSQEVEHELLLKPVLSWKSKIIYLKEMPSGRPISYGATYVTKKKSKIATIPLGYADGYSRLLSNKGQVLVRGKRVPIRGRVCMDNFMVDVSDIDGVNVGDEVVLIGKQNSELISADIMAEWIDTINYEVVCGISDRVKRIYR